MKQVTALINDTSRDENGSQAIIAMYEDADEAKALAAKLEAHIMSYGPSLNRQFKGKTASEIYGELDDILEDAGFGELSALRFTTATYSVRPKSV